MRSERYGSKMEEIDTYNTEIATNSAAYLKDMVAKWKRLILIILRLLQIVLHYES